MLGKLKRIGALFILSIIIFNQIILNIIGVIFSNVNVSNKKVLLRLKKFLFNSQTTIKSKLE
ncbi:MAG: hypothetical protein HFJ45_00910 [Clostridia bacterium]|nr:hypothetical protein [Clostridia bacterium]